MLFPSPRPLLLSLCGVVALAASAIADPIISEFMADNATTLADENGAYSDWIEIFNPDTIAVDLTNWSLTDDNTKLTKWKFPAVTLQPGGFLLVWADGTSKRIVGQPLHASFSLSKTGEFLALVKPDGVTISQQFSPKFPSQDTDRSYGISFDGAPLVSAGMTARYFIPTSAAPPATWNQLGFADGAWASGQTGIGFGLTVPGMTVRQIKKNTTYGGMGSLADLDSLFAQPAGSAQFLSDVTEIAPYANFLGDGGDGNFGSNEVWPSGTGDNFGVRATGYVNIPTAGPYTFGQNTDDGGRIRIDGANVMVDDSNHGPTDHFGTVTLSAGLHTFEAMMWENGGGDEMEFYAAPGTLSSFSSAFKLVGDTANGGLVATTLPSGSTAGGTISTNVSGAMQNVSSTCYVRVPFTASGVAAFTSMTLKMRYNDGFVAYLNGTEVARRNAPAGTPAYNSTATASRTDQQSGVIEPINVTAFLSALQEGNNVLAVQGLNVSASDGSFLVLPELVAGSVSGTQVYFVTPTPGAVNSAASSLGKVADVQFSAQHGYYTAGFNLTLSTSTAGSEIHYTTDGSDPTLTNGTLYSAPIPISATTVIRAAGFKANWDSTLVFTQTYLFASDIVTQSSTGAAPAGWPTGPINGQIIDYGMDPRIVNSTDSAVGGVANVKAALTSIPSVCITTPLPNLFDPNTGIYVHASNSGFEWERPCSVELIGDTAGGFQINAGLRIRGGYSRDGSNPKHGFHLYFRSDYGASKLNYALFGRQGTSTFDQIDLRTSENYSWSYGGDSNQTFLREEGSRDAQLAMGDQASHCRYLNLYINGQYWGLYDTDERTEASFASSYGGGSKEDYDTVKDDRDSGYVVQVTDGTLDAWQDLWNKSRAHFASPTNANYFKMMGLAADGVTPTSDPVLLDPDDLIDYMLLTFWMGNEDGCVSSFLSNDTANNWFGTRSRVGKLGFKFYAHDFEHSYGLPSNSVTVDRTGPFTDTNNHQGTFAYSNPYFLHQDLIANAEYKMRFADHVQKHLFNNGALVAANVLARANTRAAQIDSVMRAESARWGDSKTSPPLTRTTWLSAKNGLFASFISGRQSNIISQLRTDGLFPSINAPTLSQFGGSISSGTQLVITPSTGTTYYTLDGTDPRKIGGGVSTSALVYTSGSTRLFLASGGARTVRVRALSGTTWSALDDALFLVDVQPASASNLTVTQIMYRPADPSEAEIAAGFTDPSQFEFIELTNIGSQAIDLNGVYFSTGISFDFTNSLLGRVLAAGGRVLLVSNKAAFEARYGTGLPVAGEFSGSLDNSGEQLTILNAAGTVLRSLIYSPTAPWPTDANNGGYSLVLKRPSTNPDPANGANWRASGSLGGSPGASDGLTYAGWKSSHGITDDNADEDGDGLNAWMEYALGGSLTDRDNIRAGVSGMASFTVGGVTDIYATITCTRRVVADDVSLVAEGCTTLAAADWTANGIVLVSDNRNSDGSETLQYRSAVPQRNETRHFFRVRATLLP